MKKLIAGNWKMNGSLNDARELIANIVNRIHEFPELHDRCEFLVCPSYLHIPSVRHALHSLPEISFGAQDCSEYDNGAFTGDVSAAMLKDAQCTHVIVGHSEPRQYHNQTDAIVAKKAQKAHEKGLVTIICVGEKEQEREQGREKEVVQNQLGGSIPPTANATNTIIAYEPVWAIGTGKTATPDDVKAMHSFIHARLSDHIEGGQNIRILYGGSMKPENAGALLAIENVDGGLIGGASLDAEQYLAIAKAA